MALATVRRVADEVFAVEPAPAACCALERTVRGPLGRRLEETARKLKRGQRWEVAHDAPRDEWRDARDVLRLAPACRVRHDFDIERDLAEPLKSLAFVMAEAARAATAVEDLALIADERTAAFVAASAAAAAKTFDVFAWMGAKSVSKDPNLSASVEVLAACRAAHAVTKRGLLSASFAKLLADLVDRDDLAMALAVDRSDLRDAARRLEARLASARGLVAHMNRCAEVVDESRGAPNQVHDWRNDLALVARANTQNFHEASKTPPDQHDDSTSSRIVALTLAGTIRCRRRRKDQPAKPRRTKIGTTTTSS